MNDNDQFGRTWLEEEVLDIAEEDVDCTTTVVAIA